MTVKSIKVAINLVKCRAIGTRSIVWSTKQADFVTKPIMSAIVPEERMSLLRSFASWLEIEIAMLSHSVEELGERLVKAKTKKKENLFKLVDDFSELEMKFENFREAIFLLAIELRKKSLLNQDLDHKLDIYQGIVKESGENLQEILGPKDLVPYPL